MEDALALVSDYLKKLELSGLNPCFNGRCTRTFANNIMKKNYNKS